jgi:argininosuccinate lyase
MGAWDVAVVASAHHRTAHITTTGRKGMPGLTGEVQLRERLSKDPSAILVEYVSGPKIRNELDVLFDPQMQIHIAHTLMLMERNIIPDADGVTILRELLAMNERGANGITPDYTLEDLYSHIEKHLVMTLGADVAGRMHTARSRNDLGVTVWRMVLRSDLLKVRESLLRLREVVLRLADEHAEVVMPGYTHSQHAQPITLGYYFAAFADVLARDARRIDAAYATNNCNPLGAAALTTTGFPIDRLATTRRLGFDGLVEVGFDAVASRDDAEEASCALAMLGVHLARVAEDLFVWHTTEFALVEFSDDFANVSSIMPQKKNPGLLEYVKKNAGHLIGTSTQVLAAVKGSWFTDASDATDGGNEPMVDACHKAIACMEALAGGLSSMEVKADRMLHLARIGYGTMTEVADTIVRESGVSFRVAHNIVGKTVVRAVADRLDADQITPEMFEQASQDLFKRPLGVSEESIRQALDPTENIRRRTVQGGTAPEELRRMIAERNQALARDRERFAADRTRVEESKSAVVAEARSLVASAE